VTRYQKDAQAELVGMRETTCSWPEPIADLEGKRGYAKGAFGPLGEVFCPSRGPGK